MGLEANKFLRKRSKINWGWRCLRQCADVPSDPNSKSWFVLPNLYLQLLRVSEQF